MIHPAIVTHEAAHLRGGRLLVVEPTARVASDTFRRLATALHGTVTRVGSLHRTLELATGLTVMVAAGDNPDSMRGLEVERAIVAEDVPAPARAVVTATLASSGGRMTVVRRA